MKVKELINILSYEADDALIGVYDCGMDSGDWVELNGKLEEVKILNNTIIEKTINGIFSIRTLNKSTSEERAQLDTKGANPLNNKKSERVKGGKLKQ